MAGSALVIGGAGFLGTGIVNELKAAGWKVTSAGRGNKPNTDPDVAFIRVDRAPAGALAAALGGRTFDLVVDCALYRPAEAEDAVPALSGKTGHYVFISTDFVYAPTIEGPFPIKEDAPKETERPYGAGKVACEGVLTRAFESGGFPFTALRPPHIMGAGKELGGGTVEGRDRDLLTHIREGRDVTLLGEGLLAIQPVWNREIGACIAHLAGNERAFGQVFNCTGPECVTTRRYYAIIAEQLGVPLRAGSMGVGEFLERWPDRAPFARHRIYDLGHLKERTGYAPRFSLEDAIAETVQWMAAPAG